MVRPSTEVLRLGKPPAEASAMRCDLIVSAGTVLPMTAPREVLLDGAVAVHEGVIVAVGPRADIDARYRPAARIDHAAGILTPGLVDGHQHLTGDRLARSAIPDELPSGRAIFEWAVPLHQSHDAGDEEVSAGLACAEALLNGVTTVVEAGTVARPAAVAAAAERAGIRVVLGRWTWDRAGGGPFEVPAAQGLAALGELLDRYPWGERIGAAVTLVGHDLVSDELLVGGAELAAHRGVPLTLHLSPTRSDPAAYLARTGRRPVAHLSDLGVLGSHLLVGHAVHLDDEEVDLLITSGSAVVSCPWAYLRLAQGISAAGRHGRFLSGGGRLALGCDSENAGDGIDILRTAALAAGLIRDAAEDPGGTGAWTALELATVRGADAVGLGDLVGALAPGLRADLTMHRSPWATGAGDPAQELIWGGDGRHVTDVVVDGEIVVADGELLTVDLPALQAEGLARGAALRARAGVGRAPAGGV